MLRFESPSLFIFLWVVPLVLVVGWAMARRQNKKLSKVLGAKMQGFLVRSVSPQKRRIKLWLQTLCLLMLVIAWARPQAGQSLEKVKSEGVEILLVVDVSESMMAEDVKPSRLDQVKAELSRLVDLMPGNKIGVIAFAGSAALLSPITNDPAAIKMYLESLTPYSVSSQGTHFEAALRTAKEAFDRGGVGTDDTNKVTRVILMASDGEDHEPGALAYADELTKEGIRIFTMAYGTEKGGAIPVRDGMGFLKGYKKDRQGQTILTTVKGEELQKMAAAGKGSFYFASFGGDHIRQLAEDIGQLEKTEFDSSVATQYEEKFQIILFLAILVALLELFIGDRRSRFMFWKGRYEVPPS